MVENKRIISKIGGSYFIKCKNIDKMYYIGIINQKGLFLIKLSLYLDKKFLN